MNEPIITMATAQITVGGKMEMTYEMPMTVSAMSAMVIAGLNMSNRRLL